MDNRLLRPLLIVVFLIAIQAVFTVWSEVGGQYHLDLMVWPWKLGIGVASAWLIAAMTANLVRNEGKFTGRGWTYFAVLIVIFVLAGMMTYYYHINEPTDQDDDDDDEPTKISLLIAPPIISPARGLNRGYLPGPAGFSVPYHR